jgi:hypothetical protein
MYVEKDTVIRSKIYFKVNKYDFVFQKSIKEFIKDSLHYIINSNGIIMFSSEDFTTVFDEYYYIDQNEDTIASSIQKMAEKDQSITVPAGGFSTSNMRTTITTYPKYTSPGVNNPRYMNKRFAKNVGMVTETEPLFLSSNFFRERRLIRYKVN